MAVVQKRKIRWAISLFLVMLYFSGLTAQAQYGGGSGAAHDPYLIYTAEQMNAIGLHEEDRDKHFKLMADIDLAGFTGTDFNIIGASYSDSFTGVFNGNGHTISNFTYDSNGVNYIGLFGYVYDPNAEIKDLGFIDPDVDAGKASYVGSLVGYLRGTITNCYVQGGSVSGSVEWRGSVGGLVGINIGTISNCYSIGSVSGDCYVGGLVGSNSGTITNCYSAGTVSGDRYYVGGLAGRNGGTITNCHSSGSVTGNDYVGGLVGYNRHGTITNCYSTGSVSGETKVGGLVGYNGYSGTITCSYTTSPATGDNSVGGLVGYNEGTISDCSSAGSVSGDEKVGGLVGYNPGSIFACYSFGRVLGTAGVGGLIGIGGGACSSYWDTQTSGQIISAGGTGKTTAEMQMASTFLGWGGCGNEGIWTIDEGNDYPRLWWENKPGEALDIQQLSDFLTGAGTEADPYLIYTAEQINVIGLFPCEWDKHFKLMTDIDLSGFTGTSFNIIGISYSNAFTGVFDGNGRKIYNFSYTSTDRSYIGLFGNVRGENAQIKDLGLIDPDVDAGTGDYVGSLVGRVEDGTISNCYVQGGSVSGSGEWRGGVGGLVGALNGGTISNCYAAASVSGDQDVGGLVGFNRDTIIHCYSTGSVSGGRYVGGLVGDNRGSISNSYSTGDVSGWWKVGGLVGWNDVGTITNCYSTGSVTGGDNVGGLVGENRAGKITNCYATGSVSGNARVGGLVAYNRGTIFACYSLGTVLGTVDVGGLIGIGGGAYSSYWDTQTSGQATSDGGTGKTTAEMQDPNTFMDVGWDFVGQPDGPHDIWAEPVGAGYPIFWWQLSPLPALPTFSGGTGETGDPYLISTAGELNSIGHNPRLMDAHFRLINDIDLTGIDFYIVGSQALPFTGVFDGNGHTISNFSYTYTDTNYVGLFGYVKGENTLIKDLGLIDPNIDAGTGDCVGSLVGSNSGRITNCYVKGGSVLGTNSVGGLVGENWWGRINSSYSTGSVAGTSYVGGLVGSNWVGTITNCYATGSVTGTGWGVGGLVGDNEYTITNCYATGSVSGNKGIGGLVGDNGYEGHMGSRHGTISNCYSSGSVSGNDHVGGLVGYNYGWVYSSFWDIQASGQETSDGGTGLTTAEMQMQSTFTDAGWDFVGESVNGTEDIWSICEGTNYPRLVWQIPAGDFVCPDGITIEDFVFFAEYWRDETCDLSNDYCQGTDLDFSGTVDEADLEIFIENWLAGGND